MWGLSRKELWHITGIVTAWRVMLFVVGWMAPRWLPFWPAFTIPRILLEQYPLPTWLANWANFDGVHYLTIAQGGYIGTGLVQAFFPVWPYFILRPVEFVTHWPINWLTVVGLGLSAAFTLGMSLTWFGLLKKWYSPRVARAGLLLLLFFPTGFFFGALYTEALFLWLVFSCVWAASEKSWGWATFFAFLATGTRLVGVFLIPALWLELLITEAPHHRWQISLIIPWIKQKLPTIVMIGLAGSSLLAYMAFLWIEYRDPLYFLHVQSAFNAGRQTDHFILYPQVAWRAFKILASSHWNLAYLTYTLEFLAGTVGLLALLASIKYVRASWWLFSLAAFLLPTLTGTFSSLPRYFLVCWPAFILLAHLLNTKSKLLPWLALSTALLILTTIMFVQGYWVA
jgi:Gpi18-like mannosyltransferase